jgi:hypothetical protein
MWTSIDRVEKSPYDRRPMTRSIGRIVAVLATVAAVAACLPAASAPGPRQMALEAERIQRIMPLLDELGVTQFTNEDGCAWLIYARGGFYEGGDSCQPGGARPFDALARADHARIVDALASNGAPTRRINGGRLGPDGRLLMARFVHSAHPFPDYWEYLYDPDDLEPKVEGGPMEVEYTRIDGDWWFQSSLDD